MPASTLPEAINEMHQRRAWWSDRVFEAFLAAVASHTSRRR